MRGNGCIELPNCTEHSLKVKYLIVGPSWVGDMVMAQSLFITLKQQHPGAVIDVLAPQWSSPILERMPEVRQCVDMPLGHGKISLGVRKKIGRALRIEQYQQAIILPNSLKSALIPFWADIPVRTGWRGEMRYGLINDIRHLNKKKSPLMVERFVALGYDKGVGISGDLPKPQLQVETSSVNEAIKRHKLTLDKPVLAICPGAEFGVSKQWPTDYYAQVALTKIEARWQVWLFGSEKDHQTTSEIMSALPESYQTECFNLAGQTSLADAVDLLSVAAAVISNDSGLMHVAAALFRPLVAIYGSTTAAHTPPMNTNSKTLWLGLDCSPCFKRECPLGHHNCMKQLSPETVVTALAALSTEKVMTHQEVSRV